VDWLIAKLEADFVVIWGARMTGLGVFRALREAGLHNKFLCWIDSDPAFKGKVISGKPVIHPGELSSFLSARDIAQDHVDIFLAAALKSDSLIAAARVHGIGSRLVDYSSGDEAHVTVDIMGACNLSCGSCPHSIEDSDVPKGSMSLETFKQVLDKISLESPHTKHLALYSWGEPFLHPKLPEMVALAHAHGFAVALSSNLSFGVKFGARLAKVIAEKPEYLKISVSGWSQSVYQTTHQGGDVNLVKSNLYFLRHVIDEVGEGDTLVDINYHLYRNNMGIDQLGRFRELADDLGFLLSTTHSLVMPLERVISLLDGEPDRITKNLDENLLTVPILDGIRISGEGSRGFDECPFAFNQLNINSDLTVPVCCTVYSRGSNVVSDNFLVDSLDDISARKRSVELCSRCMRERLPEYNLGLNRTMLDEFASKSGLIPVENA